MKRRTLIASIGAVAGTTLGAAAYTSATVNRSAEINVQNDAGALITLTGDGEYATVDGDGVLGISISDLNKKAAFTIGDENAPETGYVFSVENNYDNPTDVVFSYSFTGATGAEETEM